MSRLSIPLTLSLLGLSIAAPAASAEADLENGKVKFVVCQGCHGPTASGSKEIGAPRIAGQNHWYERRQLRNFKAGIRGVKPEDTYGIVMRPMALTLITDKDVVDTVAYLGTLKPDILPETIQGGDASKGKETFTVCAVCHGDDGRGIEVLSAPRSAGIPDWYLLRQIQNFDKGIRGTDSKDVFGRQMGVIQKLMLKDDQAILDVITYINSLPKE